MMQKMMMIKILNLFEYNIISDRTVVCILKSFFFCCKKTLWQRHFSDNAEWDQFAEISHIQNFLRFPFKLPSEMVQPETTEYGIRWHFFHILISLNVVEPSTAKSIPTKINFLSFVRWTISMRYFTYMICTLSISHMP